MFLCAGYRTHYPWKSLNLEDHHDVPLEDMWYSRPQLFFTCALRPKDGWKPKNTTYKTGPDDKMYSFVFFNTFEAGSGDRAQPESYVKTIT